MKTLNIEALAKSNRTITIGGQTYEVVEMTVENFIETTKAAEALGDSPSFKDQVLATSDLILRYVPSMPREVLHKLSLEQLTTVIKFLRGDMDGQEEQAPAAEDKKQGK